MPNLRVDCAPINKHKHFYYIQKECPNECKSQEIWQDSGGITYGFSNNYLGGIGATWTKAQVVTESQKVTSPESIDMEAPSTIEKESPSNDTKKHVVREVLEKRDANHRHWEVVKQIEIIDPVTKKVTIEEDISKIIEVGCGICYQNDQEDWQVTEAAWQKTDDGFVMNTAGYKLEIGNTVNNWLHYVISDSDIYLRPSGIYASDGTNEQEISTLNLAACGQIDPEDNSRLIFADAYGAGIDLELQVCRTAIIRILFFVINL